MTTSLQLVSTVQANATLEISLRNCELPEPKPDEVLIRVDATPINPSDLGLLIAGADLSAATTEEKAGIPTLTAPIPQNAMAALSARINQPLPVGNEGAGVVIEAGSSPAAQALLGQTVAVLAGGMYAQHRCVSASSCLKLPAGTSAKDAASCFVNPLTALGMIETMKLEGHQGLVHTAAASNLGQMLNKACIADGVPLVNIVRTASQAELLRELGAAHVCNSSDDDFHDSLVNALTETKATLAFDAIGGGSLANDILEAMERVASSNPDPANRYGSTIHKQVYLYGMLDPSASVLKRSYGMAWGVGGWLLPNFLARVGSSEASKLRARVAAEITTTFASDYSQEISLSQALQVDIAQAYLRKSTGEKYLITPNDS